MDDAQPDTAPLRQIDRKLLEEAKLYKVPYAAYVELSAKERASLKQSWARRVQADARRRGLDPDEFLAMSEEAREDARQLHPVLPKKAKQPRPSPPVADMVDEELSSPSDDDDDEEEAVHSSGSAVPATEADPSRREKPTLGDIRPSDNEDLVGWAQPKNLRDVYARYTIGDGQHYIRIERVEPKVYQQIPCSGYLGELRDPLTEDQFNSVYGGRIYQLQVYGPDPKGRKDPMTGLSVIKAKTDPFRYTVPILPPNLAMLPGRNPKQEPRMNSFNPFQPAIIPSTPADAQMHKSTLDFLAHRERQEQGAADAAIRAVTVTTERVLDASKHASEAREQALKEQLADMKSNYSKLEEKLERAITQQNSQPKENTLKDAGEFLKQVSPQANVEAQLSRLQQSHVEEVNRINTLHREQMEALKTRHVDERARDKERFDEADRLSRARVTDAEQRANERVVEIERRMRDRETEQRNEIDRVRREERDTADRRVADKTEQADSRIKDLTLAHEREIRTIRENHETRTDSKTGALDLQITNLKEKVSRLEEELDEAREEAKAAGDPVTVLKKAKEQAEQMGYTEKDENAPQTAGERFAAVAGLGLSRFFESAPEWLPKVADSISKRPAPLGGPGAAPRGLAPGQQPTQQQQRQAAQRPRARTVAWASSASIPITGQEPNIPPSPTGPSGAEPAAQPPPAQEPPLAVAPAAPAPATEAAPQPTQAAEAPPPAPAPAPQNGAAPANRIQMFSYDVMVEFRREMEKAIEGGATADVWARMFANRYPEPAVALVSNHKPEDLFAQVESMENGKTSAILRRDGRRWVEAFWATVHTMIQEAQAQQPAPQPPAAAPQGA